MTKGVGLVGTGTSAVDVTAMSGVSEERTDKSFGNVMAVSDVGDVALRTCVGKMMKTSPGSVTAVKGASDQRTETT